MRTQDIRNAVVQIGQTRDKLEDVHRYYVASHTFGFDAKSNDRHALDWEVQHQVMSVIQRLNNAMFDLRHLQETLDRQEQKE